MLSVHVGLGSWGPRYGERMRARQGTARVGRRRGRLAAIAAAAALVLTACSDDDASDGGPDATTTTAVAPDDGEVGGTDGFPAGVAVLEAGDDLYALAEDLEPGEPGQPIAVQPVDGTDLDATVWRILHHSRALDGEDVAVSGLIAVPTGEPPEDGWPVASWAHGTTGIADECAPSRTLELGAAAPLLERGLLVVATDYEGLGTPGRHPYLVGESQGRGVLDVIRAAQALGPAIGAGDQAILWGHSQGGHAVLFANEIAAEWAPEIELEGTVAGAPPSQLPLMADFVGDGPGGFFLAMVVAGWAEAYDELDPADVLTPAGLERLDAVDGGCARHVAETWGAPTTEALIRPEGAETDPWPRLFEENDPGHRAGTSPVLVIHGGRDEIVPVVTSALLVDRMCEVGQPVQRLVYDDADHTSVVPSSLGDMLEWIDGRLAGQPAPDDCESIAAG